MPTYPFLQVDAFTERPLAGNPCAILFDTEDLDEATMLAIAREMNLSETSFVRRSSVADFGARYFTPAGEIPLAGHPTIATVHALVETGRLPWRGEAVTVTLELAAGVIAVDLRLERGRLWIVMNQPKPTFLSCYRPEEILPVFHLTAADVMPDLPLQTVSTGTPQLMVPLKSLEELRRVQVDLAAYQALRQRADFFSVHLFCLQGVEVGQTFARHIVAPPDVLEDPFTGSATGAMAAYLWHYGLLSQPAFIAEQGHWLGRPGQARVEVVGPPQDIQAVRVGGTAVTVLNGELKLPAHPDFRGGNDGRI